MEDSNKPAEHPIRDVSHGCLMLILMILCPPYFIYKVFLKPMIDNAWIVRNEDLTEFFKKKKD